MELVSLAAALTLAVEVVFCLVFRFYLVPRANQRTAPVPYRGYEKERHKLLVRIMNRLAATSVATNQDPVSVISKFLHKYFHQVPESVIQGLGMPSLERESVQSSSEDESSQSSSGSSSEDNESSPTAAARKFVVQGISRNAMSEFLAWGFFGKHMHELEKWELDELESCHYQMQETFGVVFGEHDDLEDAVPRRMTLEDVIPLPRPLAVYGLVYLFKFVAGLFLRIIGYQRLRDPETGLVAWFRPARPNAQELLPLLFFHGIAPAGFVFYLPMILSGLAGDGRAVMLFENPNISCTLGYKAHSEAETVRGVEAFVKEHLGPDAGLLLAGHSFGSVPLTWLLHAEEIKRRIRQFVLIDPVTILLSEPDVMVNFLYQPKTQSSKIRMVASSELFTEYYLRRHFAWYNAELWMEDLPSNCKSVVALSEADEIVASEKVQTHLQVHKAPCEVLYWKGAGHASCVTSPSKWRQLKRVLLEQEMELVVQQQQ